MRPDRLVSVHPTSAGWCVRCDLTVELVFLSGARAEEHAHSLARGLAGSGSDVRVDVHDRRDQLVASRRYFGDNDLRSLATDEPRQVIALIARNGRQPGDAAPSR